MRETRVYFNTYLLNFQGAKQRVRDPVNNARGGCAETAKIAKIVFILASLDFLIHFLAPWPLEYAVLLDPLRSVQFSSVPASVQFSLLHSNNRLSPLVRSPETG